jgi:DNA-directed RNA polymerase subunit RPC12/RpoP
MNNIETELVARARGAVKDQVRHHFEQTPLVDLASLDNAEALARELAAAVAQETFAEWASVLEKAAVTAALTCPGCGHPRKVKRRAPMEIRVLGLSVAVAKPYLECARCEAPGVSIGALVTGLVSGTASSELTLRAAYAASQHSYGKASRDIAAHYGETVERTGLRRLALEVEKEAMLFTERERAAALARLGAERRVVGVPTLMLQGDGGTVRTGTLVPCVRG